MPSRYRSLAAYLAAQPAAVEWLTLSLAEIEVIVGMALPPTARTPRWWVNNPAHPQGREWLRAGWHVTRRSLGQERPTVTFARGRLAHLRPIDAAVVPDNSAR